MKTRRQWLVVFVLLPVRIAVFAVAVLVILVGMVPAIPYVLLVLGSAVTALIVAPLVGLAHPHSAAAMIRWADHVITDAPLLDRWLDFVTSPLDWPFF